ncbi:MAG: adenylate/guanylate cyclase domain-containing protein [Verrucomicrobiales bacterium]|nr:adenylate/guanylate cyclase domain-containing protein [Verrucomicrobiales bacterium]
MRFQTKLVITLVMAVIGVTIALMTATEMKIRQTYVNQFSSEYNILRGGLEQSRKNRSEEFMSLCRMLAAHPFVIETLKNGDSSDQLQEFWKQYTAGLKELEPSRSPQGPNPQASSGRAGLAQDVISKLGVVALMNLEGVVTPLEHPRASEVRRGKFRRSNIPQEKAATAFQEFLSSDAQQTIFLPMEYQGRKPVMQEMVSTPVVDPETGETVGLFLRASSSETDAERSLERYQEEFGIHRRTKSGIYLGGDVYSRSLDEEFAANLGKSIADFLKTPLEEEDESRFETFIEDEEYLVYVDQINKETFFQPAYQLAAFPIGGLRADLAEFRVRGSGIGASVLLVSIGIAFLLARNLAGPINELATGTKAIREGNFDHRVPVKTGDEIGDLASSFNEMAEELKQKALYRELLGKVSDETVAQALVSGSLDLELGGEIKEVSVLFCDIRGFTRQTEKMHPSAVISMLNDHMTAMTDLVRKHKGVVDKFVGDEIMAVFGGLKSYGNDAANAAACALEMIEQRRRMNQSLETRVEIGIGVATGEVVAGCMGSVDRLNYTVLGSRVNLAARLCSSARPMEVITDDETIRQLDPFPDAEVISDLSLKGFSESVQAFRLRSIPEVKAETEVSLNS